MWQNPELAGSLWTTGEDYDKFLEAMYFHRGLPLALVREMETDQTPSMTVKVSQDGGKRGAGGRSGDVPK